MTIVISAEVNRCRGIVSGAGLMTVTSVYLGTASNYSWLEIFTVYLGTDTITVAHQTFCHHFLHGNYHGEAVILAIVSVQVSKPWEIISHGQWHNGSLNPTSRSIFCSKTLYSKHVPQVDTKIICQQGTIYSILYCAFFGDNLAAKWLYYPATMRQMYGS